MTYAGKTARNHPLQVMKRGAIDAVDDRRTPQELFDRLHAEFNFTIDVAASRENAMLPRYRSIADDGLARYDGWIGERVWCNPPYSDIRPWVVQAMGAIGLGCQLVVMLLPSNRTDQPWWQDYVEPFRDGRAHLRHVGLTTRFLRGRIRFTRPGGEPLTKHDRPLFGCVLLIWRRL